MSSRDTIFHRPSGPLGTIQFSSSDSLRVERLRLLFLHPKTLIDFWPFPVDTLGEIVKAPSAVYPVLAATVSDLPVEIEIFDGYVSRESYRNYKRRIARADIIAISVMSPLKALDTELTIRLAKSLNPKVRIVLGGNHATAFAERWIEVGADAVIVGEGEFAFRALIERLGTRPADLADLPNLVHREGDAIVTTGIRAPKADLESAPLPRWDLMDLRPYTLGLSPHGKTAAVEVSRGCPHRCDFCNINTFWNYKQHYKSVARVCQELEALRAMGVTEFIFTDDNFGQDFRHMRTLFEEMVRRKLGMRFGSFMRGDTVCRHPELIELGAQAGLSFCLIGIETLDPKWLDSHRKGVRAPDAVAMYADVYKVLRKNNVFVIGLFINPLDAKPGEVSGQGADGLVCDVHYTADLLATKGSTLYDKLEAQGSVAKDMFYHDWNLTSITMPDGQVQPGFSSIRVELAIWSRLARRAVFSRRSLMRRFFWRNLGVVAERLLCTTQSDIKRYFIARDRTISLAERQRRIAESAIDRKHVSKLSMAHVHKSPLSLRNGLWSLRPVVRDIKS
jgi:anaerobic magnesium-protoporphyrin IX monomethyl ester cyclase